MTASPDAMFESPGIQPNALGSHEARRADLGICARKSGGRSESFVSCSIVDHSSTTRRRC